MFQKQTNSSTAQRWIVLVRSWEIRKELVTTEVQDTDDHFPRLHAICCRAVYLVLFFFRWETVLHQEHKFSAVETDAVGIQLGDRQCVGGFSCIYAQFYLYAVQSYRRQLDDAFQAMSRARKIFSQLVVFFNDRGGWIKKYPPRHSINN